MELGSMIKSLAFKVASFITLLGILNLAPQNLEAISYEGRASIGSFISRERFSDAGDFSDANDYNINSARFYINATKLTKRKLNAVFDMRTKYDLFDKLDEDNQKLQPVMTPQIRQLYVRQPKQSKKYFWTAGRFQAFSSGAIYVDGIEGGMYYTKKMDVGIFLGLNPKSDERSYLEFNSKAQTFGAFLRYEDKPNSLLRYIYSANAIISQSDKALDLSEEEKSSEIYLNKNTGSLERMFLFNQSVFHFKDSSILNSLIYLDLKPDIDLQNYWLSYHKKFNKKFSLNAGASEIHAIDYRKQQDVREELPSSSYQSYSAKVQFRPTKKRINIIGQVKNGKRKLDNLSKNDVSVGIHLARFLSKRNNLSFTAGSIKNFISNDEYFKLSFGHHREKWELNLALQKRKEKYGEENGGKTLNPLYTELDLGYFFSKKTFSTFALQIAKDENVSITTAYFRLSYNFGNKKTPPVRDSSATRGLL